MYGRKRSMLLGACIGAAIEYFADPKLGRTRRVKAKDMARARLRRGVREMGRQARHVSSDTAGAVQRAIHPRPRADVDDITLADRIRSDVLRELSGRVLVDVVDGCVTLRGRLDDDATIRRIEGETAEIPGVNEVRCLINRSVRA